MKQLVIFPLGSLSAKDKERLSKEGFVAVETIDPTKVIMPLPSSSLIQADDMLMAALHGCSRGYPHNPPDAFFEDLHRRMKEKEKLSKESPGITAGLTKQ